MTMSRTQRIVNVIAVIVPFVAFLAAIALLWNKVVGWHDLALMLAFYVVTCLGVTVGYHRHLTHRAFATSRPMSYALAILGSMAVEGPVISWVADHRKHHAHTDREGDPHSPHTHDHQGLFGAIRGLWHAHVGWLWSETGRADATRYARDLVEDRGMRIINRSFFVWAALGFAVAAGVGWAITGTVRGALIAALWGGLVRVFLLHHVTWSINSICHFFGRRRFATDDESRNVFWLALPSMGEAWHHNHHAFPRSAFHGLRRREVDPSGLVIAALERLGLVWDVVRIAPERQAARALPPQAATLPPHATT
jgi:stearoyl-CoA desaturase (delta-9 desaturase)